MTTRVPALLLAGLGVAWLLSSACAIGVAPQGAPPEPVPPPYVAFALAVEAAGLLPEDARTNLLMLDGVATFVVWPVELADSPALEEGVRRLAWERAVPPFELSIGEVVDPDARSIVGRIDHRRVRIR